MVVHVEAVDYDKTSTTITVLFENYSDVVWTTL